MARNRKDAVSPLSVHWTLYKPEKVQEKLNNRSSSGDIPFWEINKILEETGFNKAVRIREALIKEKTCLIQIEKGYRQSIQSYYKKIKALKQDHKIVREKLELVRNILRIPRENPDK